MTKDELFTMIAAALFSALVTPVVNAFMPSKDRLKVLVKTAIKILFAFLIPIGFLIYLFFNNAPVNKKFIFEVVTFAIILVMNIMLLIFDKISSDRKVLEEDIKASFVFIIKEFSKIHSDHLDLSKKGFDATRQFTDKTTKVLQDLSEKISLLKNADNKEK